MHREIVKKEETFSSLELLKEGIFIICAEKKADKCPSFSIDKEKVMCYLK